MLAGFEGVGVGVMSSLLEEAPLGLGANNVFAASFNRESGPGLRLFKAFGSGLLDRSGVVIPKLVTSNPSRNRTVLSPRKAASKSKSARDKRGEGDLAPEIFTDSLDESSDATGCRPRGYAVGGAAGWRDERKRPAISNAYDDRLPKRKQFLNLFNAIKKILFPERRDLPDGGLQ